MMPKNCLMLLAVLLPITASCVTSPEAAAQWSGARFEQLMEKVEKTFGDPAGMVRLHPESRVWADKKNKRLAVDGFVALREGQLEMLACIAGTKEHESIVAVFSKAQVIHGGLLAIGAEPGHPVRWDPKYEPPTGESIRVIALWRDEDGKKRAVDTRTWVREVGTVDKTLEVDFVFAGSSIWEDPDTGEKFYQAEQGDLICVANFSTATLDVPLRSLKSNAMLSFVAFTDRIPPEGTPIRLILEIAKPDKASSPKTAADEPAGSQPKVDAAKPPADAGSNPKIPVKPAGSSSAKPQNILAGYERLIDSPEETQQQQSQPADPQPTEAQPTGPKPTESNRF